MPYPYSNDLGKQRPADLIADNFSTFKSLQATKAFDPKYPWTKKPFKDKYPEADEAELKAIYEAEKIAIAKEQKAAKQKQMMDQLFGANPSTIKFPDVQPKVFKPDFKGNPDHAMNKYGKADLTAIPEEGPEKFPAEPLPHENEIFTEYLTALFQTGVIDKTTLYKSLYGGAETKPHYQGFTQVAEQMDSYDIHMEFKVTGLAGCDDEIHVANQTVSKQFIAMNSYSGKSALEKIVDDMLRQIKASIMEKVKKAGN